MDATYPIELFGLDGMALSVARAIILTGAAVLWTLLWVRVIGLRALSKMTAFDFVATVATASLIAQASARADWMEYVQVLVAIASVFLLQWLLARTRLASGTLANVLRNEPRLLMKDGHFIESAMRDSRITRQNVLEKIRLANATSMDEVCAVVLETTGDVSVITGRSLDPKLMEGVRGFDSN